MDKEEKAFWGNIAGQQPVLKTDLDASASGIVITDFAAPDNPIIYCNKAFEQLTGYTPAEVIGKNCRFLQGKDYLQTSRYKLKKALQEEKECHVEMLNYRKDGSLFWNELYIAPIQDRYGKTAHYIGIQNDISERKLKGINLKFEDAHFEKLKHLKNEFISAASHELKTPLTSLKASMQLLSRLIDKDLTDTKQQMLLNKANTNLNKLSSLVEDLFNVNQVESGRLLHQYSTFKLYPLITKVIKSLGFGASHNVEVSGDEQLEVTADYDRIEQVVINLLNNAVKYAPLQKHIQVTIAHTGYEAKVAVIDHGMGISSETLPHVFDRYYRDKNLHEQVSGLGLGLYTSREIIRSHHGILEVESVEGKGCTFWFTLPLLNEQGIPAEV